MYRVRSITRPPASAASRLAERFPPQRLFLLISPGNCWPFPISLSVRLQNIRPPPLFPHPLAVTSPVIGRSHLPCISLSDPIALRHPATRRRARVPAGTVQATWVSMNLRNAHSGTIERFDSAYSFVTDTCFPSYMLMVVRMLSSSHNGRLCASIRPSQRQLPHRLSWHLRDNGKPLVSQLASQAWWNGR